MIKQQYLVCVVLCNTLSAIIQVSNRYYNTKVAFVNRLAFLQRFYSVHIYLYTHNRMAIKAIRHIFILIVL